MTSKFKTRRDLLKAFAAVPVSVSLSSLTTGCNRESIANGDMKASSASEDERVNISEDMLTNEAVSFVHGVASGDPLSDAVILWTRLSPQLGSSADKALVSWRISKTTDFAELIGSGDVVTGSDRDWTVKLDVSGLEPDTQYYYQFEVGGFFSPTGRTRTLPIGDISQIKLAVCTCSDWSRGLFNAYGRIAEREDLNVVIHLGDYIYENDRSNRVRPQEPPVEIRSLAEYRARYATHRTDKNLAVLHQSHPMIWVWDDHETCDGAWVGGADPSNHNEIEDGPWELRKANALQAALEWMPIRSPNPDLPERIYREFTFGSLAQLLMLDTRRIGRDKQGALNSFAGEELPAFTQTGEFADEGRHILGLEQEQWLAEKVSATNTAWRLIGNQVVFSPLKVLGLPEALGGGLYANPDQWDGYSPARNRVIQMLADNQVDTLILTGDVHASMVFDVAMDPNNPADYNPLLGTGSLGVEFVTPSISSAGDPVGPEDIEGYVESLIVSNAEALRVANPHLKMFEATLNGYLLLTITPTRATGEFWTVPTVVNETTEESLLASYEVLRGRPFSDLS